MTPTDTMRRRKRRRRAAMTWEQGFMLFCYLVSFLLAHHPLLVCCFTLAPTHRAKVSSLSSTSLTGIKGFRVWFESQFPEAILSFNPHSEDADESFDHVLLDVNQLIHVALRRSRSDGHAMVLFLKELDSCFSMAVPKKSVVLAMDGPPSAAKLATQRRRRYSTYIRTEWKKQQLSLAIERGYASLSKRQEARKRRGLAAAPKTLAITPGTAFMDRVHQAVLYWAWQRLSNRNNAISGTRIYFSPSTVPGEGEVKLLDWLLQHKISPNESIAILGGDSDLVLEGLVIPPSITHNVFVLLPEDSKNYLAISLWETTRALSNFLPKLDSKDMMRVRTDLVLLLIMNGNDYLPKLRGSAGFNNLFHNYLRILHQWLSSDTTDSSHGGAKPFLVDPDTLEFNLPFTIAFFRHMAQLAPENLWNDTMIERDVDASPRVFPLSQLHNMGDSGFIPRPIKWTVIPADNKGDALPLKESDVDQEEDTDSNDTPKTKRVLRLTLGEKGTDNFYAYELPFRSLKKARHELADLALDDILGEDRFSFTDMEEEDDDMEEISDITNVGYEWEIQKPKGGKCDRYLAGLLWNLQTYQDGVCTDYAYNYGRRMSPTAKEIVAFFKEALDQNRTVGPGELLGEHCSPPVSAGLSCLAALPLQVSDLIPDPYRQLAESNIVEEIYADCMDADDNMFDLKRFEQLCLERIAHMNGRSTSDKNVPIKDEDVAERTRKGRRILLGDHYWTVIHRTRTPLTHPFLPPEPFSERLSHLRPNRKIQVSRVIATSEPFRRDPPIQKLRNKQRHSKSTHQDQRQNRRNSDMGAILETVLGDIPIAKVGYKKAYQKAKDRRRKPKKISIDLTLKNEEIAMKDKMKAEERERKKRFDFDVAARMEKFNVVAVPSEPLLNPQGSSALQILQQLADVGMVGDVEIKYTLPSQSPYAAVNPQKYEHIQLTVKKSISENSILAEELAYEQDRDTMAHSKKALRQHLASLALCDLVGPEKRWTEMRYEDLKRHLLLEKKVRVADP